MKPVIKEKNKLIYVIYFWKLLTDECSNCKEEHIKLLGD